MIITCPHCQTRYEVAFDAIGSVGRKVQCAHCQQAWQQVPLTQAAEDDKLFAVMAEDGLDEAMAEEERQVAAELARHVAKVGAEAEQSAGMVDPQVIRNRQRAFSRRRNALEARLPLAQLRRSARIVGVLALVGIALAGYFGRTLIVERLPAMAGLYAQIGLGVNVVGLDFAAVETLRTQRNGKDVLVVSAELVGLEPNPVAVPPVVITLVNLAGDGIYQWSTQPKVSDLMVGERAEILTELSAPPPAAVGVRLSFAGGSTMAAIQQPAEDHAVAATTGEH